MVSYDELKEIDIKNHLPYYFNDIMRVLDTDFDNILLDKKWYKRYFNLWHFIQNFYGWKTSPYYVQKIDGLIKIYDGIRYLVFFAPERYNLIYYNRIRCLISEKSGTTDKINHNFASIRIDSYNSLSIEKIWTFHNVIILIKSVVNKNENNCYYNLFLNFCRFYDEEPGKNKFW